MKSIIGLNIVIFLLALFSGHSLAQTKFVFATHAKPPLSDKIEAIYQAAFHRMGYSAEFIILPGRRIVYLVNKGIIDGDASRLKSFKQISSDKTDNYLLVDEAIINIELVIIVKKEADLSPVNWQVVNEGSVAYISGSMNIQEHVDTKNRNPLPEAFAVLEMVKRERVRSAILFKTVATDLFKQDPSYHQHLKIIALPLESFNLYPFLNKKHENLQIPFKKTLQAMKADGTYREIMNRF